MNAEYQVLIIKYFVTFGLQLITFDRSGSAYIGGEVFATDQSRDEVDDIRKFDLKGNLIDKYDVDYFI